MRHTLPILLLLASFATEVHAQSPLRFQMYEGADPALFPNSILIMGEREAVLIDGQWWLSEGAKVADLVEQSGRELTTVLITHAHPDHYTGLAPVLERFPDARVLARRAVQEVIRYEYPAKLRHWQELVPDEMPVEVPVPEIFDGDSIMLEGHEIRFVDLGPGETLHATAFYIPSASALVVGDLIFNGTHAYFADLDNPDIWIETLESLHDIGPIDTIYPGHGPAGGPEMIDAMIEYIAAYQSAAPPRTRVADIARAMTARYPDYRGAVLLWVTRGPGFGLSGAAELGVPPEVFPGAPPEEQ
jgi:glyoxylase-like metal-dependent hydrolase (beta-lactamase superfamily II)